MAAPAPALAAALLPLPAGAPDTAEAADAAAAAADGTGSRACTCSATATAVRTARLAADTSRAMSMTGCSSFDMLNDAISMGAIARGGTLAGNKE